MKKKYRNIFFVVGLLAVVVMLLTMDVSLDEVWTSIRTAGWWFLLVLLLWPALYLLNTCTWWWQLKAGGDVNFPFWWLYKVMWTGFAMNSATPGGLTGSEPYKVMELTPFVGVRRATSSVLLFTMTHILSHFCFWMLSVVLYLLTEPMNVLMAVVLSLTTAFCCLGFYVFAVGYRNGFVMKTILICTHIPLLKKWTQGFLQSHRDKIDDIDNQIAQLQSQSRGVFYGTLLLELFGRVLSCLEIYFIMMIFHSPVTFVQCILILAFTSLFANLLFFLPMQVGGREGGFAMSVSELSIPARHGVFVSLICRVREIVMTAIGLALMKVGNIRANEVS